MLSLCKSNPLSHSSLLSFLFNPGDQGEIGEEGDQGRLGKSGPPGLPGILHPSIYYTVHYGEEELAWLFI